MNFRTRLTILTTVAIAVTLVGASFATYSLAHREAFRQVDDALQTRVDTIRAFQRFDQPPRVVGSSGCRETGPRIPAVGPGAPGGFSRVLDEQGNEVQPTPPRCRPDGTRNTTTPVPQPGPRPDERKLPKSVQRELDSSRVQLPISKEAMRLADGDSQRVLKETIESKGFKYRVFTARVGGKYTVQTARPIDETERFLDRLLLLLAGVTIGGTLLSVAAALVVTGAATRPIHELTELATAVRESGDLSQRVAAEGSDDLARLARNFNSMLGELQRSVESQLRLVDDASHQMRTPLASIRTNMDVLMRAKNLDDGIVRDIMLDLSTQVDELTGLVRDLVDLASGVESTLERAPVRLDAIAEEALRLVRGAFPAISFETRLDELTVNGNEERLVRLVQNLLHNAAKWSPSNGVVELCTTSDDLRVIDHGPGVPDSEKPRIFERFHRAPDARDVPGSGLGLAIVKQIASDHDGIVRVEDTPGGGATFVVWIPTD